jgi:GNAT superfamily N-acetyltransferase
MSFIESPGQALSAPARTERLEFLQAHLGHCTAEYLDERLEKYNLLLEAHTPQGVRAAMMFGHLTELKWRGLSWPLLHLGLSVVHTDHRGQSLARELPKVLVRRALARHPVKFSTLGIWLSAKCSSPASYQSLKRATEPIFHPTFSTQGELEPAPEALLQAVQSAMGLKLSESPILYGANQDARFQLPSEDYRLPAKLLKFYRDEILPSQSEVLCMGLWHPLRLLPGARQITRALGARSEG